MIFFVIFLTWISSCWKSSARKMMKPLSLSGFSASRASLDLKSELHFCMRIWRRVAPSRMTVRWRERLSQRRAPV